MPFGLFMELRDPICSASHLLTAIWAVFATVVLLRITPPLPGRRIAVAVYGLSMVLLYLASGTFHGVPFTLADNPTEFRFFQKLDQSAIYILIAGTNTPCLAILIGGRRARWYLGLMWSIAAIGIACHWLLPKPPHYVIVGLCLGMGYLGGVPLLQYYRAVGWRAMNWMWLGAACYTLGAICELTEWPMIATSPLLFGYHEVMHLFDTAGSVAFFVFISRYVVGFKKPKAPVEGNQSGVRLMALPKLYPTVTPTRMS
jgi:hemolysin III